MATYHGHSKSYTYMPPSPPDPEPESSRSWASSPGRFGSSSLDVNIDLSPFDALSLAYLEPPSLPRGRATSYSTPETSYITFPEPQLHRSISSRSISRGEEIHPYATSDSVALLDYQSASFSDVSTPRSDHLQLIPTVDNLSQELSGLTLQSEEGLRRFQSGELAPSDEEWHRLVPPEAREALGKREVQRQSVLFEVFKSERDYVADLEAVQDVFIEPLMKADPPIIPRDRLEGFVSEVFYNLDAILAHHQRMLAALFQRQHDQHPLIQSVADVILETTLLFTEAYDAYIKHYPLAESRHRTELKRNEYYQVFIQKCAADPRIRKRDLNTFLSRPVTRLPRLSLILEQVNKLTDEEHPDKDTLPLILGILSDFIKSTQPGIAAAESKVKYWDLCESLAYMKGEIIDLDLYDESRTMVHSGSLARKQKSDSDLFGWTDLFVALLDNYFLITRERKHGDTTKRFLVSRPIPLEYLRLAEFDAPAEYRREKADDGRLLESLRTHHRAVWPFTVYHAADKAARRYTLYSTSEAGRMKWFDALVDAMGVRKVRQEANMLFAQRSLTDDYFTPTSGKPTNPALTGKILSAVPFVSGHRAFLAVGCEAGVYVGPRGESSFTRVLPMPNAVGVAALQHFNKFLVQCDASIYSYSLDLLARVSMGTAQRDTLEASMEKVVDGNAVFFRTGEIGRRTLLIYAVKGFWDVTVHTVEAIRPSEAPIPLSPQRNEPKTRSFRQFGEPITAPKDVHDVTPLIKTVAILGDKAVVVVDPTNTEKSTTVVIPDLSSAPSNPPVAQLKARIDEAKPLGLVRSDSGEILIIYNTIGCYVDKHGDPGRKAGYIRWETRAYAYAQHGPHVLLFSPEFIEVRTIQSGRLVQVIEGENIAFLHQSHGPLGLILFKKRAGGIRAHHEEIIELYETVEIGVPPVTPPLSSPVPTLPLTPPLTGIWDEWDV